MTKPGKRERLVNSASILFHQHGTAITSLADIAQHAHVPIGNVYYYFKTKEELALAAIHKRREEFATAYALLDETIVDPRQRLIAALAYFDRARDDYARYGCPLGKIVNEGDAQKDHVTKAAAAGLEEFIGWAQSQFEKLGQAEHARRYATSIMAAIQGATLMAKANCNPQILSDEVGRLNGWLAELPNRKIQLGKVGMRSSDISSAA